MQCPQCTKESPEGSFSCQWCGATLNPVNNPSMQPIIPAAPLVTPAASVTTAVPPSPPTTDVLPEGVKGWSWAAFLWTWLWAIGNKTYIGLLALLPIPGVSLVMMIILGLYGREWAWKNKQWASVDDFNRTQRSWVKWWIILTIVGIVAGIVLAIIGTLFGLNSNQTMTLPSTQ